MKVPLLYPLLSLLKTEDFDKAFMNAIGVRPLLECLYSKVCVQGVCLCDCVSVWLCLCTSLWISQPLYLSHVYRRWARSCLRSPCVCRRTSLSCLAHPTSSAPAGPGAGMTKMSTTFLTFNNRSLLHLFLFSTLVFYFFFNITFTPLSTRVKDVTKMQ